MTIRQAFITAFGEKGFKKLPKIWKDHIRRVDSLPKPLIKKDHSRVAVG